MKTIDKIRTRNKIRKLNFIKKSLKVCAFTAVLVATLVLTGNTLMSNAQNNKISFKYYKSIMVEYGDTLESIAIENSYGGYNINKYINEVMYTNHLEDDTIHAGQYLIVPYFSGEFVGN